MDVAKRTAELSYAERLKVGTVIVKNDRIISCGYNGLPAGWEPNTCEYEIFLDNVQYSALSVEEKSRYTKEFKEYYFVGQGKHINVDDLFIWKGLKTFDETIHSEANAISQLASSTESGIGATLFCTHSPCLQCSKIIYGSGIKVVYYDKDYRCSTGIDFLEKCDIEVIKYNSTTR
jgi:dCMP deaminase